MRARPGARTTGCIIRGNGSSPARSPGGLGRGDARFSVRTDNLGRASPETASVFRRVSLISLRDVDENVDVVTYQREEGVDVWT